MHAGQEFMRGLNLSKFGTANPSGFARQLDRTTLRLQAALPRGARRWGLARKLLNIFLRDALYSVYLSRKSGMTDAEFLLEIPLDSITAKRIRGEHHGLPKWRGVRHLTPDLSAAYQIAAAASAEREGVARVHLDAYWWGARE
jgi:hypothetical protein